MIANSLIQKADKATTEANNAINISQVTFNSDTGVFTFIRNNGTSFIFDTALEKVPASFELVEENGNTYLKITNVDGTFTKTDVTRLLNVYTFLDSETIHNEVNGYEVSPSIKEGSIKNIHLHEEVLEQFHYDVASVSSGVQEVREAVTTTQQSASDAASSASASKNSASAAKTSEKNSYDYSLLSESYAKGGTGVRNGEAMDNAKYYMEQARSIVNAGGVSIYIQSSEPSENNCIWIKPKDVAVPTTEQVMTTTA